MKMSNHSIGARMATALGLVLALLLGAALFGIATLYRTLGTYDTTVLERVAQERAVSRMESEFKTQVLEWKNTLLRGEELRPHYSKIQVLVGEPLAAGAALVTSGAITPESFHDRTAPIAGPAGLADAVRKGLLRKATAADAEAWSEAVMQNNPQRDLPPVAGKGVPRPPKPGLFNAYVVLEPFTYPSGLYGGNSATFLIPRGVPKPAGNPGHSSVYDFNTLNCQGVQCSAR